MIASEDLFNYSNPFHMHIFSTRSKNALLHCHQDLQTLAEYALQCSEIDFCITEGHRSAQRQALLFKEGKTLIDGRNKQSKHNFLPARAFDFCAIVKGKATWEENYMCYLAGVFIACAHLLKHTKRMQYPIRWGGNWNRDGIIIQKQTLVDMPHIELIKE